MSTPPAPPGNSSLSMRLGLTVSLMGAALVLLLATLAYLSLSHELDTLARKSLQSKLEQIQHSLISDLKSSDLAARPHSLLDLVMGHDNLRLSVLASDPRVPPLLDVGGGRQPLPRALKEAKGSTYLDWNDKSGSQLLSASQPMPMRNGEQVRVVLSLDRSNDQALLSAYLRSTVIALPLLLGLIGIGAWWLVQRGLLPLQQFSRVAAKVTTQDLTHRLNLDRLPRELAELGQGINVMLQRLDGGVQRLSQFSDDLAHELRSPISNLMGKAQVTLSRERPPQEYKAVLEASIEELERVTRMVADMLLLAQVSQPASQARFARISLRVEARKVMELFALSAEDKQLELQQSGDAWVLGDRLMIQRAISNLLSNAIRHSPSQGRIQLRVEQQLQTVSLTVSNPGPGIEACHLPHLFERFYRIDSSRTRAEGGTGLGLAIVRSIMNLHDGQAEVSSVIDGQTEFRLVFPKLDPAQHDL
ncbi:heavy metal sensor histidine kinase [Pseudomonas sp. MSSRFD41]|uniref:heavy metal sensor histidine kinase n=1 Tax=unclassified Pseudomonas TaxID=196821 RepID=UPI00163ACFA2|nr:heavy metal sensor histidine kinase [Pseudomonas sp. MSSRFD41]MBC2658642.1 heavy metal sensor histidine kinase [Pseudomonas sp. MSSRFD41]